MSVTVGQLFIAYMRYAARSQLRTRERMAGTWRCYLSHLADTDATQLFTETVVQMRDEIANNVSAKAANNATELLSTMYNRAIYAGTIGDYNPIRGIRKFALDKRGRTLQLNELPMFFRALAALKNASVRDYFLTCLLTGEQCGKVLAMRWEDIDLERGIWFINQRSRKPRTLYLLPEMVDLLKSRRAQTPSPWVFPSACSHTTCSGQCQPSRSGHLEVRADSKSWAKLLRSAGLKDFRLNDLRNSRVNIEPVRAAMAEHYYAPMPRAPKPPSNWHAEKRWKDSVMVAVGAPIQRVAMAPPLELSPYGESTAPTFRQLFEYYMEHHGKRCKSAHEMRQAFNRYLAGIADRPADKIAVSDVAQLHTYLGDNVGRPAANRALEIIKAVYNRAIKWQLVDMRNPAVPVSLYPIESRDRFLRADEIQRLMTALEQCGSPTFRAFVKVCLYTGQREGNVESMRWQDLDLDEKTWRIPMTKNGKPHVVPLIPEAIAAIESQRVTPPPSKKGRSRRADANRGEWVFPGRSVTGHMVNPARSWERLLTLAGIDNARIHDLRRTLGSWQCKTGASLPIIGKTLGHSNPRATQIYARLDLEPARAAMQTAVNAMHGVAVRAAEPMGDFNVAILADMVASAVAARLQDTRRKEKG